MDDAPAQAHSLWAIVTQFEYWPEIGEGTLDTLIMTGFSLLFTVLIGLPLGVALFLTSWSQRVAGIKRMRRIRNGTDRRMFTTSESVVYVHD